MPRLRFFTVLPLVLPSGIIYTLFFIVPLTLLVIAALESPITTGARLLSEGLVLKSLMTSVALSASTALLSVAQALFPALAGLAPAGVQRPDCGVWLYPAIGASGLYHSVPGIDWG